MVMMDGFWFGIGLWAATGAIFIFLLIVTLITGAISSLFDRGKKDEDE